MGNQQFGQIMKEESKTDPMVADYTRCQSAVFVYSTGSLIGGNL